MQAGILGKNWNHFISNLIQLSSDSFENPLDQISIKNLSDSSG